MKYWNDAALAATKNIINGYCSTETSSEITKLRSTIDSMIDAFWMSNTGTDEGARTRKIEEAWTVLGSQAAGWAAHRGYISGHPDAEAESIADLLCRKQRDYGHENISRFGFEGLLVRVHDKIARLENLDKSGREPENESIKDNILDVIGYACIGMMVQQKTFWLLLK
jgi:hypothetical protein